MEQEQAEITVEEAQRIFPARTEVHNGKTLYWMHGYWWSEAQYLEVAARRRDEQRRQAADGMKSRI